MSRDVLERQGQHGFLQGTIMEPSQSGESFSVNLPSPGTACREDTLPKQEQQYALGLVPGSARDVEVDGKLRREASDVDRAKLR